MRGSFNTFGMVGSIVDQPIVFARSQRVMEFVKLARQGREGSGEGIGCHRRLVLGCGCVKTAQVCELEPLDPVEAMGYDDYR